MLSQGTNYLQILRKCKLLSMLYMWQHRQQLLFAVKRSRRIFLNFANPVSKNVKLAAYMYADVQGPERHYQLAR